METKVNHAKMVFTMHSTNLQLTILLKNNIISMINTIKAKTVYINNTEFREQK